MTKLDTNAEKLFLMQSYIVFTFLTILSSFVLLPLSIELSAEGHFLILNLYLGIVLLSIVFAVVFSPWFAHALYENYGYELKDTVIEIQRGIYWKKLVSIPYGRIQNIDVQSSPFSRMFGLVDVQIQTAGISGVAQVEGRIPGLKPEIALHMKEQILARVSQSKQGM